MHECMPEWRGTVSHTKWCKMQACRNARRSGCANSQAQCGRDECMRGSGSTREPARVHACTRSAGLHERMSAHPRTSVQARTLAGDTNRTHAEASSKPASRDARTSAAPRPRPGWTATDRSERGSCNSPIRVLASQPPAPGVLPSPPVPPPSREPAAALGSDFSLRWCGVLLHSLAPGTGATTVCRDCSCRASLGRCCCTASLRPLPGGQGGRPRQTRSGDVGRRCGCHPHTTGAKPRCTQGWLTTCGRATGATQRTDRRAEAPPSAGR